MKENVVLKGDREGLFLVVAPEAPFSDVLSILEEKLETSSEFFVNTPEPPLVRYKGARALSREEGVELCGLLDRYGLLYESDFSFDGGSFYPEQKEPDGDAPATDEAGELLPAFTEQLWQGFDAYHDHDLEEEEKPLPPDDSLKPEPPVDEEAPEALDEVFNEAREALYEPPDGAPAVAGDDVPEEFKEARAGDLQEGFSDEPADVPVEPLIEDVIKVYVKDTNAEADDTTGEDALFAGAGQAEPVSGFLTQTLEENEPDEFILSQQRPAELNYESNMRPALTVHRTLRGGQEICYDGTIIIFGDVNPTARVIAKNDIIVAGITRGVLHAGCKGDETASVAAGSFDGGQIRIAGLIVRAPDHPSAPVGFGVAKINNGRIEIQTIRR